MNPSLSAAVLPPCAPPQTLARVLTLVLSCVILWPSFSLGRSGGAPAPGPSVTAGQARGSIRLDGVLDEPDWAQAGLIPALLQQAPKPGEPTPYRTEVRVLKDGQNLYFGITCIDPEPARIAVHTMQRDGNMSGDDTVALVLDTFGDGRSGYLFRTNVAGTRLDGLISGPEELSLDWDGIWDVATHRSVQGWSAEIVIPAQTLRFTRGLSRWGFNVERYVARDRTTLRWTGATLDANLEDLSRAGALEGLADLRQGLGLSLSPYGLLRRDRGFETGQRSLRGNAGLDVAYNFTSQLGGVLTVNTDFAETEVDTRQINLTRFPLFFPEKRTFFVEGSNLFEFGLGLGRDFIPFYSRRVGLFQGEITPIDAGVKVLGRAGAWGIAALDVQTRKTFLAPRTNLFAWRTTYDANPHLRLGAIATRGHPDGVHANGLVGLDAVWRTSTFQGNRNFFVGLWGARSAGDVGQGKRTGWGFKVDYPNDLWDLSARFNEFGDALDPALGFVPRPGTRFYRLAGAYQPRPKGGFLSWVRQFFFELRGELHTDLKGRTQDWRVFTAPFNARTESGEHLEANWAPEFQRLDAPFEIAPGVVIPPSDYRFDRFRVEAQSSEHRPWRIGTTVWFGDFYDGRLTQLGNFVTWTEPSGHLALSLEAENAFGYLRAGNFIQRLWQLRGVYAFDPDLSLSSFFQYDSQTRNLGMNTRLRWTVHPGADLFLVWNRGWREEGERGLALKPTSEQIVVKLRWTFRS